MNKKTVFGDRGHFFVGCNYWASNAGIRMWSKWDEKIVEEDLRLLSENGVEVMRVFPLWPDFQPICDLTTFVQSPRDVRFGDEPLPDTEAGRAGMSEVMLERFHTFASLAEKYSLKLVVGLITGWMSGRMFVPPALERRNVLSDPEAIQWECRFIRVFVRRMRECPAIVAWDLGNECNCMGSVPDRQTAWVWANTITQAIRGEDPSRPVVSGMHGLKCFCQESKWMIADQSEITDVLTTHPYPLFTPHCNLDIINTFRNAFHAAAETRMYGDVGNCPAFVEEAGSLGPSTSNESRAAAYLDNMLWNSFAHDCRGLLWWCAHDQDELTFPPYDWTAMERELGLMRSNREPKPVLKKLKAFGDIVKQAGLDTLAPFRRDAVVILSRGQDSWGCGFAAWLLAKQAGFDVKFQSSDQLLEDSKFYILPSIRSSIELERYRYLQLLEKVENGATLLVTCDGGILQPFSKMFGIEVDYRATAVSPGRVECGEFAFDCGRTEQVELNNLSAEVLAVDAEKKPAFTRKAYGKGTLLFCNVPVEWHTGNTPRMFEPEAPEFYRIYRKAAEIAGISRNVVRDNVFVTLTEHPADASRLSVIAVNNLEKPATVQLEGRNGWKFASVRFGNAPVAENRFEIPGNSGVVLEFVK